MRFKAAITTAVAVTVGLLALLPGTAGAFGAGCSGSDEVNTANYISSAGETNLLTLASKKTEVLGFKSSGTDEDGMEFSNEFACVSQSQRGFRSVAVYLGDKNDTVRSDAKNASTIGIQTGLKPLSSTIDLVIDAAEGNDRVFGHKGDGVLRGGKGNDLIVDAGGNDVIKGGNGKDTIRAKDGKRDLIDCGAGKDHVKADKADVLSDC